jgi:hypothetical protein
MVRPRFALEKIGKEQLLYHHVLLYSRNARAFRNRKAHRINTLERDPRRVKLRESAGNIAKPRRGVSVERTDRWRERFKHMLLHASGRDTPIGTQGLEQFALRDQPPCILHEMSNEIECLWRQKYAHVVPTTLRRHRR